MSICPIDAKPLLPGSNLSPRHFAFTILTVLALSVGQILFKLAARGLTGTGSLIQLVLSNHHLWIALTVYGVATAFWIGLLREIPLHIAYPFVALAFLFVPVLGHWMLDEPLRWQSLAGALVIIVGVWISVGLK
jgi:undecaprenyl phosphate-alpha-L-ara4N flippase subunit ArnE